MGLRGDGRCDSEFTTEPDINVPESKDEDLSKDKAVNKALEILKQFIQ
ncbi:hypothetical protein KQI89_09655 [Clostridium sp. MSJ-4]|uniref:Uncharacterized protein n=1 Tax=Clostridium simiarum TaxID=2841506 RepID=A0ABS6F0L3_9CLOT|nr:hypothetical protein [Clostridium simiarum]